MSWSRRSGGGGVRGPQARQQNNDIYRSLLAYLLALPSPFISLFEYCRMEEGPCNAAKGASSKQSLCAQMQWIYINQKCAPFSHWDNFSKFVVAFKSEFSASASLGEKPCPFNAALL